MEKHFILYKTVNLVTSQYYIGVHGQTQDDNYLGSGIRLKRQIQKYGKEAFSRETLAVFPNETEAFQAEISMLKEHLGKDLCLNLSKGGDGGPNFKGKRHTEATRQIIRQANLDASTREHKTGLCGTCQKPFTLKTDTQKFCSRSCVPKELKGANLRSEEHRAMMRERMKGKKNAKGHTAGPKRAAHNRWHVYRNLVSPDCELCSMEASKAS